MGSKRAPNKKSAAIYARLLNVEDPEKLDKKAFAKSLNIDGRSLGGMLTQMKKNPQIREDLMKQGFTDAQIPGWVANREADVEADADKQIPDAAIPAGTPLHEAMAEEVTTSQVSPGKPSSPASQDTANAANKPFGNSQRIEPVGSDSLQQWMQAGGIEEINGRYWQGKQLPTGETALIEVHPPRQILKDEQFGNAEISSMMFRTLEVETQAFMRKVVFNPQAFTYYSWAKSKGILAPEKDFADFVNQCIQLTMTKIFGARIGVIVNTENTLMGILKSQRFNEEVDYPT